MANWVPEAGPAWAPMLAMNIRLSMPETLAPSQVEEPVLRVMVLSYFTMPLSEPMMCSCMPSCQAAAKLAPTKSKLVAELMAAPEPKLLKATMGEDWMPLL